VPHDRGRMRHAVRKDAPGGSEASRGPTDAPLTRWLVVVAALVVAVSIGLPLLGTRVFHASDLLLGFPPWLSEAPPGFEVTNPLLSDTVDNELPSHVEYRRRVLEGDYPMWNPFPSGGRPLAAVPDVGSLSPLHLPYLTVPLAYAPGLVKLLEIGVAIGFTFLFLRRLRMGRSASLLAGLVYAYTGFQVVWTNWPQPRVGAWIPALFWALERTVQVRTLRSVVPVALATAVLLFEGFPSVAGYALLGGGAYLLVRAFGRPEWSYRWRIVGQAALAVVLGGAITAVQILPFTERLGSLDLSYRVQGTDSHLPADALVTMWVPNAFGTPGARNFVGPPGAPNYVEIQTFVGAGALTLVAAGILWRRRAPAPRGVVPYLWGTLALCGWLTFVGGPLLGLFQLTWLFQMNPVGRLRSLIGFLLAVLAGIGFQAIAAPPRGARPRVLRILLPAAGAAVGAAAVIRALGVATPANRGYVATQVVVGIAFLATAVGAVAIGRRVVVRDRPLAVWTIPLLIAGEALFFTLPYWPRIPRDQFYPVTPAHEFLGDHLGSTRLAASAYALLPGSTTAYGLRSLTSNTFQVDSWNELTEVVDPLAYDGRPLFPALSPTVQVASSPALDRLAVSYFVAPPEVPPFGKEMPLGVSAFAGGMPRWSLALPPPGGRLRGVVVPVVGETRGECRLVATAVTPSGEEVGRGNVPVPSGGGMVLVPMVEGRTLTVATEAHLRISGTRCDARLDDGTAPTAIVARDDGLRLVFTRGVLIYERLRALPRIRWAERAVALEDRDARLEALARPLDAATVVLEQPASVGTGGPAEVRVLRDDGDRVLAQVDARAGGYLVVADALQQGWRVWVDGSPAPLLPADHALVAVHVPDGIHTVEFRYAPRALIPGLLVSSAAILLLLLILAVSGRRRRARHREALYSRA
jgi:hypothetical protein